MPMLSIIVPTRNNVRYTAQCLASIAAHTDPEIAYEVIAVDNGSDDETLSFLGSHTPGQRAAAAQGRNPPQAVRVLHNPAPCALAASWNMGCAAAAGEWLLISNNDVIYAPGAIEQMLAAGREQAHAIIVLPLSPHDVSGALPRVVPPETPAAAAENVAAVAAWAAGRRWQGEPRRYVRDAYPAQGGYAFLLRRDAWRDLGGFDEDYDLTGEDYDFFRRAQRRGKIVQARHAFVEHYGAATCQWLYDDYHIRLARNRFRLAEKQDGQLEMFSVVIPVYNRVHALRAAIESLRAQTFPHWKAYVIDDGSDDWDRVQALAGEFRHEAGRLWFFHRAANAGPGAARNFGLSLTRGKYVAFLDSDDIWYPGHLQAHWDAHEIGGHDFIYSDADFAWRWWDEAGRVFRHQRGPHPTIPYTGPFDAARLQEQNYIQTSALSVWGEAARAARFSEDKWVGEDWDYCRALGPRGLHLAMPTCRYHIARNPESEHLIHRAVHLAAPSFSWEGRLSIVRPHQRMEDAALGVVVATWNRPRELARALETVGWDDVPLVVVDDGTQPPRAVDEVIDQFSGAALLRAPGGARHGPGWARNRGVEYLPCQWVQFLDDDDLLLPGWRERVQGYLGAEWDAVWCHAISPGEDGALTTVTEPFTSQLCVRREAFLRTGGFDEAVRWGEERDLLQRLRLVCGERVREVKVPWVLRPAFSGRVAPRPEAPPRPVTPVQSYRPDKGMF